MQAVAAGAGQHVLAAEANAVWLQRHCFITHAYVRCSMSCAHSDCCLHAAASFCRRGVSNAQAAVAETQRSPHWLTAVWVEEAQQLQVL